MITFGGFSRPAHGFVECGDRFVALPDDQGGLLAAVINGLGHGPESAVAAECAVKVIHEQQGLALDVLLMRCHQALAATRGAAIGLLRIDATGRGHWSGVGNVEIRALRGKAPSVFSRAGIVGHNVRDPRLLPVALLPGDICCLISDGVSSRADLSPCLPGHPSELARRIVDRFSHNHDDATALVFELAARAATGAGAS